MNKRHACSYCDKTYSSRQGKSRHQKTCVSKPIIIDEPFVYLNTENNDTQIGNNDTQIGNNDTQIGNNDTQIGNNDTQIENVSLHVIEQNNNRDTLMNTALESNDINANEGTLDEDIKCIKYFGMEDTTFLTKEELLNSLKKPYMIVNLLLFKIYFEKNETVSASNIDDTTIRVLKKNKWSYMNKKECFLDMIDKTYNEMDMFFTYEGGADRLSEEEKKNYENFQKYYDDDNMNLKKKLCEDIEKILKNKTNTLPEVCLNY